MAVRPARPAAGYVGGKRSLSRRLVPMIGAIDHTLYAEPFVGMGGVFLRRDSRPRCEVINDWSLDVATFFRILQRHYVPFMDMLRFQLTTREGFERLMKVEPDTLTDLERAARFLYLQRVAYGGKVAGRNFGGQYLGPARFDYGDFIRRYDRPGTLFFIDPPYFGCEDIYGEGMFSEADFERLSGLLEALQGRFILTLGDHPRIRAIFARFDIEPVTLTYRLSGPPTVGRERIITGP